MDALTTSIAANIAVGVVLLALLHRRRGRDAKQRLTEPEQALARYRIQYPMASGCVSLSADGSAALLELADGTVGVVARCGRRWSARVLTPRDIVGVERAADGAIVVRFADFGWPRARVQLADPESSRSWLERLLALRGAVGYERKVHRA